MLTLEPKNRTRQSRSWLTVGPLAAALCFNVTLFAQDAAQTKSDSSAIPLLPTVAHPHAIDSPASESASHGGRYLVRPTIELPAITPAISTLPPSAGPRRITLDEAQQQAAQTGNPMVRLGELSVDAAKEHRLGVQADYFPKLSATLLNFHFNKFMGQEITIARPIRGGTVTTGLPLTGKNQTLIAVTATQPITPLFKIREVVNLARADENIARAKAGMPVAETANAVEKNYYDLLVAQRRLVISEFNQKQMASKRLIASNTPVVPNLNEAEPELMDANKAFIEASSKVKQLTASLNELLGWAPDTELELVPPDPLVENISIKEAADKAALANAEVIEAEENVDKARAASKLSKLDYVPDVAVIGGYAYNGNAVPLLPRDFSFIGIVASYNLFDFGKREHSIKERSAQVEMAQTALGLTRAKVAASVKSSYFELARARQLCEMAHRMQSATDAIDVKYGLNDPDVKVSRAKIELEAIQADLEHREAYAKLKVLMGEH